MLYIIKQWELEQVPIAIHLHSIAIEGIKVPI